MKNEKYMTLVLCKIKDSFYAIEKSKRVSMTKEHVDNLQKFTNNITHLVTQGFHGQYDQVAMIEADDLRTIYDAVEAFKMGAKGRHIEIVDTVFGLKVDNKSKFKMVGKR